MKSLLLFVFANLCIQGWAQDDCSPKLDKDSVKIWTCPSKNSKFKAVKSTFLMKGTPSQLTALVLDLDGHKNWQYRTKNASLVKKISDQHYIYYTEIEAPVVNNRDFVIEMTINQDPNTKLLWIDLVSVPEYIPHKDGIVRVPFSKARWTVTPINNETIQVDYFLELDLGGSVPGWIVNMFSHQGPYETYLGMRELIRDYPRGQVSFIKD